MGEIVVYKMFCVLCATCREFVQSEPHISHCQEPENLDETLDRLREEILSLYYTGTATFNIIPEYRKHSLQMFSKLSTSKTQKIYGTSKCKRLKEKPEPKVTCPWYVYMEYDEDRMPQTIAKAECTCKECFKVHNYETTGLCQKVFTYVHVIRRHCINGVYSYGVFMEPVPVGCTCTRETETT